MLFSGCFWGCLQKSTSSSVCGPVRCLHSFHPSIPPSICPSADLHLDTLDDRHDQVDSPSLCPPAHQSSHPMRCDYLGDIFKVYLMIQYLTESSCVSTSPSSSLSSPSVYRCLEDTSKQVIIMRWALQKLTLVSSLSVTVSRASKYSRESTS